MKTTHNYSLFLALFAMLFSSCVQYDGPAPKVPGELKDFGFATKGDVKLNIDYKAEGFKALIEVYDENPMQADGVAKKEGVEPIFAAYTDNNGKLNTTMYIPTAVSKAYIYTKTWGLPRCVEVDVTAQSVTYDASTKVNKPEVRSTASRAQFSYLVGNRAPYAVQGRPEIMTLSLFDEYGYLYYWGGGDAKDYTPNCVTQTTKYKGESIGDIAQRTQSYFDTYEGKREELLRPSSVTNIKMKSEGSLDVVYLAENASYKNVFGYYYYEEGNAPQGRTTLRNMNKYVVIPYVKEASGVAPGNTFRLKYFGKDGKSEGTDKFPANTVIGWFIISDGYNAATGKFKAWNSYANAYNFFFTNDENEEMRFVAVKDAKTGIVVLGCEDREDKSFDRVNEDYCDLLFFVKTDDGNIDDNDKPEIPDGNPEVPEASYTQKGLLAFEDIWPAGGDYDMNDVAVTYERTIKFRGDNKVTSITETFKFVQDPAAAQHTNYFAYQVKNMGNVTLPAGCVKEDATNSIIFTMNSKDSKKGDTYTITRTFNGDANHTEVIKDINPYIIVKDGADKAYESANRKEVHLPTFSATVKADQSLIGAGKDAFYMNSDGSYPFAIDIPRLEFVLSKERVKIDVSYPRFSSWTKSFGKTDIDWYKDAPAVN